MDISMLAKFVDIGIIFGIIFITEFVKTRLHAMTKMDNEVINYKIIPFVPFGFGLLAGISVVLKDANIANVFWNFFWEAIKYGGAATFLYKIWSRSGMKKKAESYLLERLKSHKE